MNKNHCNKYNLQTRCDRHKQVEDHRQSETYEISSHFFRLFKVAAISSDWPLQLIETTGAPANYFVSKRTFGYVSKIPHTKSMSPVGLSEAHS